MTILTMMIIISCLISVLSKDRTVKYTAATIELILFAISTVIRILEVL